MVPYFLTDDISASAETAAELGATVFMGPMEVPGAGIMALVTDPTGAVHGLRKKGEFKGFGVAYEANAPGGTTTRPMTRAGRRPITSTLTATPSSNRHRGCGPQRRSSGSRASQKIVA